MRIFVVLLIFIYGLANTLQAQSIKASEQGRVIVDTLASPYFYGRGYIENGDAKAAYYIATNFHQFNLQRFPKAPLYFQDFSFAVNTFPDTALVLVDQQNLSIGNEVVPAPSCPTIKGTYAITWLDSQTVSNPKYYKKFAKQKFKELFIVIDEKGITDEDHKKIIQQVSLNPYGAKGIIRIKDKITWSVSQTQLSHAQLDIVRGNISRKNKKISLHIRSERKGSHESQNVIAFIPGKTEPDSFIVITAHYDHLGGIGKQTYFPGANDNASGTAMMLSIANYFSKYPPKYSVAFIAFGGEEAGLIGSKYYTMNPIFPLKKIRMLLNLDLMGTGDEGITVVNATEEKKIFNEMKKINDQFGLLSQIKERKNAPNSDHYYFTEYDVPAVFMYTMGGIKAYHDPSDRSETLPLTEFDDLFTLFTTLIQQY
jgi:aminopeptidase YwaD